MLLLQTIAPFIVILLFERERGAFFTIRPPLVPSIVIPAAKLIVSPAPTSNAVEAPFKVRLL